MNKRWVRIQETNEIAKSFDTAVEYMSDELPPWFKPLQYIVEDDGFTNMTIAIKDVHYLVTLKDVNTGTEQPEEMGVIDSYEAIEAAIQLLTGQIINLRTELLVMKANINTIAIGTNTKLEGE